MRTTLMAVPLLGLAVLLAACGSGASSLYGAPASAATAKPAATEAPSVGAGGGATIALADTGLGKVLADGKGMTLYAFKPDNAGDSTCYDSCATTWPPLPGRRCVDRRERPGRGRPRYNHSQGREHAGHVQGLAALPVRRRRSGG